MRILYVGFLTTPEQFQSLSGRDPRPQISAHRFAGDLIDALVSAGAEVHGVCSPPIHGPRQTGTTTIPALDFDRGPGTAFRQIATSNASPVRDWQRWRKAVAQAMADRAMHDCDAILVYSVHTPVVAAGLELSRRLGRPATVFIPDLPLFTGVRGPRLLAKRLDDRFVRALVRRYAGALPIAPGIARDWLPRELPYMVFEGVSAEAAQALRRVARHGQSPLPADPLLLYTGTLDQTLRFAQLFRRTGTPARLRFVGGGPDDAALRALAEEDRRITVAGFVSGAELERELAAADAFVNPRDPSWAGGDYSFPSKTFQYLASGKPIISTRLTAYPDDYLNVLRIVSMDDATGLERDLNLAIASKRPLDAAAHDRLANRLDPEGAGRRLLPFLQGPKGVTETHALS